jgi:hypothetical protein
MGDLYGSGVVGIGLASRCWQIGCYEALGKIYYIYAYGDIVCRGRRDLAVRLQSQATTKPDRLAKRDR